MNNEPEGPVGSQQDRDTQRTQEYRSPSEPGLADASRGFAAALGRALSQAGQVLWLNILRFLRLTSAGTASAARRSGTALTSAHGTWRSRRRERAERAAAVKSARPPENHAPPVAHDAEIVAARSRIPRRRFRWGRLIGGLAVLCVLIAAGAFAIYVTLTMPGLDSVRAGAEDRLIFEDSAGQPLLTRGTVPSVYADEASIPKMLRQAVIAIEDRRFYEHGGVDLRSIFRAAVNNMRSGEVVEGGSTITQQFVKITYIDRERSFRRKFHEALLSYQLERRFSKEEILTRYLNAVYLGAGATGMPAAAHVYFNTDLANLSLAQSASLAAMIQAPSAVNPFSDLDALRQRAALVLDRMVAQGFVDKAQADAARADLVTMAPRRPTASYGSWFSDWVVAEADRISTGFDGVVTLRTTLDPVAQKQAETAVASVLDSAGITAEAALISINAQGEIVAMVGGRNYADSQFNRATDALRSPGSTFKTIVYLTALAQGFSPTDRIRDSEIDINGYSPQNFGNRFYGEVPLSEAFIKSMNAATVRLAMVVGIDKIIETARTLGITADLSATPSLALGASGVTLLDMTEAYASLATGRLPINARGISGLKSSDGGGFYRFKWPEPEPQPGADRILAARPAMVEMLRRVVDEGTGQKAALPGGAFGKTGTSQDFRDALFIGWNGKLVTGVWVGNDDNSPMDGVTGGSIPAQIWQQFMLNAATDTAVSAAAPETTPETTQPTDGTQTETATAAPETPSTETPAPTDNSRLTLEGLAAALNASGSDSETVNQISENLAPEPTGPTCNIQACERFYRSFRASDCSFQPYRGGRKLCTR